MVSTLKDCEKENQKLNKTKRIPGRHHKQLAKLEVFIMCAGLSRSVMSDSLTPWTVACQAPLSLGFSRQEYWSGWPCPAPQDLSNPGIEPRFLAFHKKSLPSSTLEICPRSLR